jgi:hypothetical protein
LICATTASVCNSRKKVSINGLAGADFAGDHHETIVEPNRRLHVRLGARMLLAQVQELRVRAQPERQFMQFEEFQVHHLLQFTGFDPKSVN